MKKITFLLFTFLLCLYSSAQQTISFEAAEGYTLGDINTQNGWVITEDGGGGFIANQVISDEMATDGTYSFKIDLDNAFGTQSSPIMGGFYSYSVPIPYATAIISADIYMSELGVSNFRFGSVNLTAGSYTIIIEFDFGGNIFVVDGGVFVDTLIPWSAMTWYNVRLETSGTTVKYFIDDIEIYEGALIINEDIEEVRFAHDNWGGFAYLDNFRTNDEALSVSENSINELNIYPNPVKDLVKIDSNLKIDNIKLFNQLGQKVLDFKGESIIESSIDLSTLSKGLYLMQITSIDKIQTVKIIKE